MMIGKALRIIRVFHDFSQKETAEKLGISASFLSEIEKGKKNATIELLQQYAKIFDMPVSSIMFFAEEAEDGKEKKIKKTISKKTLTLLEFIALKSGRELQ